MASNDLRLALIGTGGIARHHVLSMAELKTTGLDGFVVTAVCDINQEAAQARAQELEEHFGLRPAIYADYQELLSKEQLDGADLCLPHGLHHVVAIDCMEAGVNVLCEKPLGITIKASRKMAETADRTGRILSTAVPKRRGPGQRAAFWVLNESKLIGEPLAFFHQYTRPPRQRPAGQQPVRPAMAWRMDRLMSGGAAVMDSGFHYCDSMRYLLGDVEKVYAEAREIGSGSVRTLDEAREDTVFVTLAFKSGVVGTWCWGRAAVGESLANVIFYGSEGSLSDTSDNPFLIYHLFERRFRGPIETGLLTKADGTELSLAQVEEMHLDALSEEEREFLFPHGVTDGFTYEIWEFMEAIRGKREKVEVDGWEGLRSLAICEAIYESAFTGEVIRVDDVISGERGSYQAPIDQHWGL